MRKTIQAIATLLVLFSTHAAAQTNIDLGGIAIDTAAAIEVTADSLAVEQDTGSAIFTGNVIIAQGDLRLSAGKVEVIYTAETNQIAQLIAENDVTFVTADEAAEAQNALYDITTGQLT